MTDKDPERLRLDLFLKRSGLVKRRSLAATLCDNEYVKLNGRPAGPGKEKWDGADDRGRAAPSSAYVARLLWGEVDQRRKVVLVR